MSIYSGSVVKALLEGAVTQVKLELNVLEKSEKGNLGTTKNIALTSALRKTTFALNINYV